MPYPVPSCPDKLCERFRVAPQPHTQLFRGCVKYGPPPPSSAPRVAQPSALFFGHRAKPLEMSSTFSSPVPNTAGRRKAAVASCFARSLGSSWICFRHLTKRRWHGRRGGALGAATAASAEQQPAVSDNLGEEGGREGAARRGGRALLSCPRSVVAPDAAASEEARTNNMWRRRRRRRRCE